MSWRVQGSPKLSGAEGRVFMPRSLLISHLVPNVFCWHSLLSISTSVWPITLSFPWVWLASSPQGPALSHGHFSRSASTPTTLFHNFYPQERCSDWVFWTFLISAQRRFQVGLFVRCPLFVQSAAKGKVTWFSQLGIWRRNFASKDCVLVQEWDLSQRLGKSEAIL